MEVAERQDLGLKQAARPLQEPGGTAGLHAATVPEGHPGTEVVVIAEQQWRAIGIGTRQA
jgi:hypothetical protein